jgi:hypothetical protein
MNEETLKQEEIVKLERPVNIREKLYSIQLEVLMRHLYTKFLREYPWYSIDLETFKHAYMCHPLGWQFLDFEGIEDEDLMLIHDYREKTFKEICSYA